MVTPDVWRPMVIVLTIGQWFCDGLQGGISVGGASDVIPLSDSNFADRLADVDLALVKFYAPHCGHCQRMAPEFIKAASELRARVPPITLAEVDCTGGGENTCSQFDVSGYPSLKVFRRGQLNVDYDGPRESTAIVEFMKSKQGPSSTELKTLRDIQSFISHPELVVFGFFEDEKSELVKEYEKLADIFSNRIRFGHSFSVDVSPVYPYKNEIVLFREPRFQSKFEPSEIPFKSSEVTIDALKDWMSSNIHSLVGHRTRSNMDEFKLPLVVVYYDVDYIKNPKGTTYWRNRVVKAAKKFSDSGANVSFAVSNAKEFKLDLELFGLENRKLPVAGAKNLAHQKFPMAEEFSIEAFEKFVEDFLEGKMKPFLKSEPIPETNDEPVKIVVADTFDEIVKDTSKDVLVELYSPMCGHCMVLEPKYKKLAVKLQDETDLVIAKIDGTANEIPAGYGYDGFPTIYFAPKGSKANPILYEGEREVDDFVKFLAREATEPLKSFDRKGKPRKSAKKKMAEPQNVEL